MSNSSKLKVNKPEKLKKLKCVKHENPKEAALEKPKRMRVGT